MFEITEYGPDGVTVATWDQDRLNRAVEGVLVGFTWVARDRWVAEIGPDLVWHVVLLDS